MRSWSQGLRGQATHPFGKRASVPERMAEREEDSFLSLETVSFPFRLRPFTHWWGAILI